MVTEYGSGGGPGGQQNIMQMMQFMAMLKEMRDDKADREFQSEQAKRQSELQERKMRMEEFNTKRQAIQDSDLSDDEKNAAMKSLYREYGIDLPTPAGGGKDNEPGWFDRIKLGLASDSPAFDSGLGNIFREYPKYTEEDVQALKEKGLMLMNEEEKEALLKKKMLEKQAPSAIPKTAEGFTKLFGVSPEEVVNLPPEKQEEIMNRIDKLSATGL